MLSLRSSRVWIPAPGVSAFFVELALRTCKSSSVPRKAKPIMPRVAPAEHAGGKVQKRTCIVCPCQMTRRVLIMHHKVFHKRNEVVDESCRSLLQSMCFPIGPVGFIPTHHLPRYSNHRLLGECWVSACSLNWRSLVG